MSYEAELQFLRNAFQKCHLQTLLVDPSASPDTQIDLGLRKMLGWEDDYTQTFYKNWQQIEPNTIYKLTDQFLCSYMLLLLPEQEQATIMVVGPYLSVDLTHQQIMEQAEKYMIPPRQFHFLEKYYSGVPVLLQDNPLFAMIDTFGEKLWGTGSAFNIVDINQELSTRASPLSSGEDEIRPEETFWNMKLLETRYQHENEMIQAVSQGLTHKAGLIFTTVSSLSFERRMADPVRNLKNYCIIMNTLLRKAAESGGVHPIYLDSVSSAFAVKIEQLNSTAAVQSLMDEMFRSYCRLVKKHSTKQYSPLVQRVIIHIDSDLGGDLSLKTLAELQNINASYLSALFKKETGQTITEYVIQKRIKLASRLLTTTKLQIQTIAQHTGISDVNYFSKLFKKYVGKTPKEYRKDVQKQGVHVTK